MRSLHVAGWAKKLQYNNFKSYLKSNITDKDYYYTDTDKDYYFFSQKLLDTLIETD